MALSYCMSPWETFCLLKDINSLLCLIHIGETFLEAFNGTFLCFWYAGRLWASLKQLSQKLILQTSQSTSASLFPQSSHFGVAWFKISQYIFGKYIGNNEE